MSNLRYLKCNNGLSAAKAHKEQGSQTNSMLYDNPSLIEGI